MAAAACGRIGFDPSSSTGGDGGRPSGLIAWWKLDETSGTTAHDSVGTANGTFSGNGLAWQAVGSPVARALSLPGTASDVSVGTPAVLATLPALTVVAWIQPRTLVSDGSPHCFFDKGDVMPFAGWSFDTSQDMAGDLQFNVNYTQPAVLYVSSMPVLAVGQWTRAAVTWDGTPLAAGVHIYVDGHEVSYDVQTDSPAATRPADDAVTATIGCVASTGFDGLVADVQLYDRALVPSEIVGLWAREPSADCTAMSTASAAV